jgi:hypothetical protein
LKQALRELCDDESYLHLLTELFDFLNCLAILEAQGTTIYKSYSAAGFGCGYGGGQQVVLAIQSPTRKYHYDVWVSRAICSAHREVLEHEDMDEFTTIFCAWYFSQLIRMRPMLPPFSLYTFFIDKMNWMAEDSSCYNASEKIYSSTSQNRLESLVHTFINWELKHQNSRS